MTDYTDRPVEPQSVTNARARLVRAVLNEVRRDLTSWAIARNFGEDVQPHADRAYQRLEELRPYDLRLAVMVLLEPEATAAALKQTQLFWESTPKDYR